MRGCLGDTSQSAISTKQHLSSCAKSRPKAFAKSVSLYRANLEKYQIDSVLPLSTNYHPFQPHQISAPAAPTNEISKTDEKKFLLSGPEINLYTTATRDGKIFFPNWPQPTSKCADCTWCRRVRAEMIRRGRINLSSCSCFLATSAGLGENWEHLTNFPSQLSHSIIGSPSEAAAAKLPNEKKIGKHLRDKASEIIKLQSSFFLLSSQHVQVYKLN